MLFKITAYILSIGVLKRWGVVEMTIPSIDKHNAMIRLPLRKLFAWLQTLSPNKVKREIRNAERDLRVLCPTRRNTQ